MRHRGGSSGSGEAAVVQAVGEPAGLGHGAATVPGWPRWPRGAGPAGLSQSGLEQHPQCGDQCAVGCWRPRGVRSHLQPQDGWSALSPRRDRARPAVTCPQGPRGARPPAPLPAQAERHSPRSAGQAQPITRRLFPALPSSPARSCKRGRALRCVPPARRCSTAGALVMALEQQPRVPRARLGERREPRELMPFPGSHFQRLGHVCAEVSSDTVTFQ